MQTTIPINPESTLHDKDLEQKLAYYQPESKLKVDTSNDDATWDMPLVVKISLTKEGRTRFSEPSNVNVHILASMIHLAGIEAGQKLAYYQPESKLKVDTSNDDATSSIAEKTSAINELIAHSKRQVTQKYRQTLIDAVRDWFDDNPLTSTQDEATEIRDWYVENVRQILEAEAVLYKQDEERIRFAVVVDGHIRRDHSFQLSDIACELRDLYPHRKFGFEYITTHTAAQLPLDEYLDITNGS